MKDRTVIIILTESDLRHILMDHLVQKRIFEVLDSPVQVTAEVDGWGVGEVTPIPLGPSDTDGDFIKASVEILRIELMPPSS